MNTLFDLPPKLPPPREDPGAEEKRHFRKNLVRVAAGHAVILLVLLAAGMLRLKPQQEVVLWLNEGAMGGGESAAVVEPETAPEIPEVEPPKPEMKEPVVDPTPPPEKKAPESEIVEPRAAPATPKPATPKPSTPKPTTPKAMPKATPKAKATPAASPKPKADDSPKPKSETAKKTSATPGPKIKDAKMAGATAATTGTKPGTTSGGAGDGSGKGKTGTGKDAISRFGWYTDMLHDRYYSRWEQPVGIGQDVIATVKLRIMKDGTIAKHDMVKSSGNPQMDESVMSAVEKVNQIDPLPAGLGNGEYFDLNVAFKVGG
ncbi:MAG: TonB family protein [Chthoniobacteraceae bacterium]